MKREDVIAHIDGITDEQLKWLMDENGADINKEKEKVKKAEAKIATLTEEKEAISRQYAVDKKNLEDKWNEEKEGYVKSIAEKDEALKKFDGVDVEALNSKVTELETKLTTQTEEYKFDTALNGAIRDRNGRSVKAIRSLIDVEALKESKDLTADIAKALDACKADNPWAFAETENKTRADLGDEHGSSSGKQYEDWESRFMELNPEIKL